MITTSADDGYEGYSQSDEEKGTHSNKISKGNYNKGENKKYQFEGEFQGQGAVASWIDEGHNKSHLPTPSNQGIAKKELSDLNVFKGFGEELGNNNLYGYRSFNNQQAVNAVTGVNSTVNNFGQGNLVFGAETLNPQFQQWFQVGQNFNTGRTF